MYRMLCLTVAAMSVAFASLPTSAPAQVAVKQIKLTENRIEGFIAAQNDILAVVETIDAVSSDHANTNYEAELDAVTRKHGFQGLAEYDAVAANMPVVVENLGRITGYADGRPRRAKPARSGRRASGYRDCKG